MRGQAIAITLLVLFAAVLPLNSSTSRQVPDGRSVIKVTDGWAFVGGSFRAGTIVMAGNHRFLLTGTLGSDTTFAARDCSPCLPGSDLTVRSYWSGGDFYVPAFAFNDGFFTYVNGMNDGSAFVWVDLTSERIVAPLDFSTDPVTLTVPFTLGGGVAIPTSDVTRWQGALAGSGMVSVVLTADASAPGSWKFVSAYFDFNYRGISPCGPRDEKTPPPRQRLPDSARESTARMR